MTIMWQWQALLIMTSHFARLVTAAPNEHALYLDLLRSYDYLERPVSNSSEALTIKLGVILQQLINIDEKNQIVEVNAWLKYTWIDYKLRWNPEDYGGVGDVRFRSNMLWKPDVLLYNSVDSNFDSTYPTNILVYSSGSVSWIPPGIFKISCHIDIKWFPFDEQNCFFKFGSWTYDGSKIDLQQDDNGFDLSNYMKSGEWSLIGTEITRNIQYYDCCPEPYFDLVFMMRLRRRTLYYSFNLIIPCILITLMSLVGFTLPPDAGEKISLQITVMLSICIFQNYVADMSPPTSEAVPLLGLFFSCCMLTVSASVVFTVLVLNLHHRSPHTHIMSPFTRALLLHWLPWLLLMKRPGFRLNRASLPSLFSRKEMVSADAMTRSLSLTNSNRGSRSDLRNSIVNKSPELEMRVDNCLRNLALNTELTSTLSVGQTTQLVLLERVYTELKFITKRMSDEDEEKYREAEWKFAAMVIDRLCLVIFGMFIATSSGAIFLQAPFLVS